MFAGSVSVNAKPVSGTEPAAVLVIVMVNTETPVGAYRVVGANAFVTPMLGRHGQRNGAGRRLLVGEAADVQVAGREWCWSAIRRSHRSRGFH